MLQVELLSTFSSHVGVKIVYTYTDRNENKIFLIYKEIQRDRVQSHIWLTDSSYIVKYFAYFLIF